LAGIDKWLGKDAVGKFILDGKDRKDVVIENLRRWIAARGRNVTLPGMIEALLLYMDLTNRQS
jgi:DNA repair and recombination RAD54-like protein